MPQCAIVYMCEIKWLIRFDAWHHTSYCRQPRRLCRCSHFAKYVLEWESLENATWHKTLDRWGNNVLHRKYVQSRQNGCISVTTLSHSVIRFVSCLHSLFICQKWDRTIWLDQINQPKKDQMFYNIYYNLKDHHTPTGSGFPSPRNPWTAPTPEAFPWGQALPPRRPPQPSPVSQLPLPAHRSLPNEWMGNFPTQQREELFWGDTVGFSGAPKKRSLRIFQKVSFMWKFWK